MDSQGCGWSRVLYSVRSSLSPSLISDYDRNRIRADIVPVLREMHPTIHETLGELGVYMQELSSFLSEQVGNWLAAQGQKSGKENTFLIADFGGESEFFQREIISYIYTRAHDGSSQ